MRIEGKTWVVTGGGAGIGREVVLELLRRGACVAAVDVRPEGLEQTAGLARAGDRLSVHVVDITDRSATEALVDAVEQAQGAVDGLIDVAGIVQPFVPVAELGYDAIERVLDVNLMGTVHMVKSFLPTLLARPEAHIANVSSMGGFFPFPGQTMYGASKAAVKLFTEGLYAELQGTGVSVSVIMPGAVRTDITANSGVGAPGGADAASSRMPMTSPQDAARIILRGIERDRLHIYVGKDALAMSVAIKVAPRTAIRFVQRQMAKMLPTGSDAPTRA